MASKDPGVSVNWPQANTPQPQPVTNNTMPSLQPSAPPQIAISNTASPGAAGILNNPGAGRETDNSDGVDVYDSLWHGVFLDREPMKRQPRGIDKLISRHRVEYQLFPEEYFSGSDITIYMGDIWVADISRISFSLQEAVRPIYGYASYTWDEVARGSRMVQGQFVIPFKKSGYIHTVLGHIGQLVSNAEGGMASFKNQMPMIARLMNIETQDELVSSNKPPRFIADVREEIEFLLERYHGSDKKNEPGISLMQAESRLHHYESEVWGRHYSKDVDRRYQTYFYTDRTAASYGGEEKGRWDWQKVFKARGPSIYITYGPIDGAVYDDYSITQQGVPFHYTVKALHNIQFNSIGQNIDANGNPIEEVYAFIAQDID